MIGIKKATKANGAKLTGVCMGIARQYNMDVNLLRIIVVLCSLVFFPLVPILYLIFALVMEDDKQKYSVNNNVNN